MTGELSPQTITLIILLKLYLSGELLEHKALLIFLSKCLEGNPMIEHEGHAPNPTLHSLCDCLGEIFQKHKKPVSMPEGQKVDCGDSIQQKLLANVWSIDSADRLLLTINENYEFVTKRSIITNDGPPKISQRSIIGRFAQKLVVSARLLHFDESSLLFSRFCLYRSSTWDLLHRLNNEAATPLTDLVVPGLHVPNSDTNGAQANNFHSNTASRERPENLHFFERLSESLESYAYPISSNNKLHAQDITSLDVTSLVDAQIQLLQRNGTPTPAALRGSFRRMVSANASYIHENDECIDFSSLHYLRYLELLLDGDYTGAFDSLHRYFDYMVSKGSRYFYHFALISKATLHQHFGENGKALDSMEEAISVARENKDNSTLTYILSWLFDFVRKNPNVRNRITPSQMKSQSQLLDTLLKKSYSVSLSLAAISHRFESEINIASGVCFSRYYESLFKSNFLAVNDLEASFIGGCHVTSDLWDLVGLPHLANLYIDLGLLYSQKHGTVSDFQRFKFRKLRNSYFEKNSVDQDCLDHLDAADPSMSKTLRNKHVFRSIEISLARGRLQSASEILTTCTAHDELEQDTRVDLLKLSALVASAHGNFDKGLALLDRELKGASMNSASSCSRRLMLLRLNLVKCQILIEAGVPFKAFSLTLQQIEAAQQSGFSDLTSKGCSLLVQILSKAGNTLDAYILAVSVMPSIVCVNEPCTTSLITYHLARLCFELLRDRKVPEQIQKKKLFKQCLGSLSASMTSHKQSGDLNGLSKCFELEKEISSHSFSSEEKEHVGLLAEFNEHSRKGLQILSKRRTEELKYNYVERA